jgi:hypothetical protein
VARERRGQAGSDFAGIRRGVDNDRPLVGVEERHAQQGGHSASNVGLAAPLRPIRMVAGDGRSVPMGTAAREEGWRHLARIFRCVDSTLPHIYILHLAAVLPVGPGFSGFSRGQA